MRARDYPGGRTYYRRFKGKWMLEVAALRLRAAAAEILSETVTR